VKTSKPRNLKATDWRTNGMGRKVSHSYGYGLMDTTAMVTEAKKWTLVPTQQKCIVSSPYYYKIIPAMSSVRIEMDVDDCAGVNSLEHVSFTNTKICQNETKVGKTNLYLISIFR